MNTGFPSVRKTKFTGEAGVNAVSKVVNDRFQWLFRKNHDEHDFGIDGYLDIVTDNGDVTGQCIAVQIKTGSSYFKTKTANGFTFYGEKKHLNYYMNLPMPVIIIIHDESKDISYWQLFNPISTESTCSGWKLNIPKSNKFSENCKAELLKIVGPAKNHLEELEDHWAFNDALLSMEHIHYAVDRVDIESKNIRPFYDFFERIQSNDSLSRKFQGKVEISISGYDFDQRELWQIRDVKKWYKKAHAKINWLYFCNMELPAAGFRVYVACLSDTRWLTDEERRINPGMTVIMDTRLVAKVLESNFGKLNEMTDRLGMSIEENRKITFSAFDALGFEYDQNA